MAYTFYYISVVESSDDMGTAGIDHGTAWVRGWFYPNENVHIHIPLKNYGRKRVVNTRAREAVLAFWSSVLNLKNSRPAPFLWFWIQSWNSPKPSAQESAPLYSWKHESRSCSGGMLSVIKSISSLLMIDAGDGRPASLLGGCFIVVNKDKASMSCNQPASHFVWWSSRVKREQWAGGWYGSVRINDQITINHNAISLCLSPSLSHSHTVRVWHTLPGDGGNKGEKQRW